MASKLRLALIILVVLLTVILAGSIWLACFMGIMPADTRIVGLLYENRADLLSVEGVVGAGIARDENNHILGVTVYVEDNLSSLQKIPDMLGEFKVYVRKICEASMFEMESMVIYNYRYATFETVEKGLCSGHKEQAYYVLSSEAEWKNLWSKHAGVFSPQPAAPTINFTQSMVIAVFMGEQRTGGYSIEIREVVERESSIIVKIEKVIPGENCIVTMALTQPYHIIKINKTGKNVSFEVSEKVIKCS